TSAAAGASGTPGAKTIQTRPAGAASAATRPRRSPRPLTLLLDHLLPTPKVAVADGAVQVDDAFFQPLEQLQVQRAVVDHLCRLHAEADPDRWTNPGKRVHERVDAPPDPVADGHRLQQRQDQIRPGSQT